MKADDCPFRCSALAQFGLNTDIPRLARSRRHDMLHVTYLRACGGAAREDLCQILIKDIHEAMRLDARPLAAPRSSGLHYGYFRRTWRERLPHGFALAAALGDGDGGKDDLGE